MRSADDGNSMLKRNTEAECSQLEYAVEVPCLRPHEQWLLKVRTAGRAQVSKLVCVTTSDSGLSMYFQDNVATMRLKAMPTRPAARSTARPAPENRCLNRRSDEWPDSFVSHE